MVDLSGCDAGVGSDPRTGANLTNAIVRFGETYLIDIPLEMRIEAMNAYARNYRRERHKPGDEAVLWPAELGGHARCKTCEATFSYEEAAILDHIISIRHMTKAFIRSVNERTQRMADARIGVV
jgi:hypothetical protein